MSAPTEIPYWGTETGGNVLTGLVPTAATFHAQQIWGDLVYGLIDYAFSGTPDFTGVLPAHKLNVSGFLLNANNGSGLEIVQVFQDTYTIRIRTTARITDQLDETGVTGTGSVTTSGTLITPPPIQKQAQGAVPGEKPGAGVENWWRNLVGQWIDYFAKGGAIVLRAGADAWRAITRTTTGAEIVQGLGLFRFDPTATDEPGEGFLAQDTGAGRGIVEAAHPDAMTAFFAGFQAEVLPAVTENLDFGSTAANAISTQTVTVPGALPGDAVILGPPAGIEAGFLWEGFVSAADTVTIRLAKITSGTVDPVAANWTVRVIRPNTMPVITARGQKIYFNLIGGVYTGSTLEDDLQIAENAAAFELLVNSRQHRAALLDGGTIEAVIAASATADDIILATGGY